MKLNNYSMKKLIIFIFVATAFTACKRKQNPRELDSNETLAKYPIHCYNGMQDPEEIGVDCGGPCEACNIVTPTCTPADNTIKVSTLTYPSVGSACGVSGSEYQMLGTFTSGSYTIDIGNSVPNLSIAYSIVSPTSLNSTEANVTISHSSLGSLSLSSGSLYMSQVGGVYYATICNGSAYSWVTLTTYPIEGKVSCP